MGKENKKSREAGRKEYIDSIRQLVSFVQRLDERWEAMEKEKQQKIVEREERRRLEAEERKNEKLRKMKAYEVLYCI